MWILYKRKNSIFEEPVRLSIPIKIKNEKMHYFYGDKMPQIRYGSICQLVIDIDDIEDEQFKAVHMKEEEFVLITKGLEVIVEVNYSKVPKEYKDSIVSFKYSLENLYGVRILLEDDLKMLIKGDKNPVLLPCKCRIPVLGGHEVDSLNQAHTYIIQHLQENRRSYTANAFQKTYVKSDNKYHLLEDIRSNALAGVEARLIIDEHVFRLNEKVSESTLEECMRDDLQRKVLSFLMTNKNSITGQKIKELSRNSISGIIQLFDKEVLVSP